MLFANSNVGNADDVTKSVADAVKAVGAVIGANILQVIVKSNDAATLAKHNSGNVNAANGKKDAVVAVGIERCEQWLIMVNLLVLMVVLMLLLSKEQAISAVIKALDTLTVAIRKAVYAGLKQLKKQLE